jgi:hypothetical protein
MTYRRLFSLRQAVPQNAVPQSEPLGSEGGTYYVGEWALTRDNAMAVQRCLAENGPLVVSRSVEISQAGRAPHSS